MAAVPHTHDALEPVTTRCPVCHGFGSSAAALRPACLACGASWSYARFDAWVEAHDRPRSLLSWLTRRGRNRYRWSCALPCGHPLEEALTFTTPPCRACRGVGTVTHWRLSERYERRQRAQIVATAARPQTPHNPPVAPMSPMTPMTPMTPRLATAPVASYVRCSWRGREPQATQPMRTPATLLKQRPGVYRCNTINASV